MTLLQPRYAWRLPDAPALDAGFLATAGSLGLAERQAHLLWVRGYRTAADLEELFRQPEQGLHDPSLLPDAQLVAGRLARARSAGERVLVFGDFDADGLTGLAILVRALRRLGVAAEPYVPHRVDDGHGLSPRAVDHARANGHSVIVTVDCGTSSFAEVETAQEAGIDVLVTDHHRPPERLPPAVAVVNPHRSDSCYPDNRLSGSGVALKVAQLIMRGQQAGNEAALELADLAVIGTVADVAPIVGENRAIARLGLERLRSRPRPGIAALLATAGTEPRMVDLDVVGYRLAPRLNAIGRIGDAVAAVRLLLTDDAREAAQLATELDSANNVRRELTESALAEARAALDVPADMAAPAALIVAGPWPVGIIGLVAGRLADEHCRPCVVLSTTADPWRGSARSPTGLDLAAAFAACGSLFERFGGHAAAAGCSIRAGNVEAFRDRFLALAGAVGPAPPSYPLVLDVVSDALAVDYALLRELEHVGPFGSGNPVPLVGIAGLEVARVRPAGEGHTQLTLRKGREVVDAIAFGWPELADAVEEGERLDVVARLTSREFAGYESLQLEIRDVAPAGALRSLTAERRAPVAGVAA